LLSVWALVAVGVSESWGFARNRDELMPGNFGGVFGLPKNFDPRNHDSGGRSDAAPVMEPEIRLRTCATSLKRRLSFDRRKREPLRASVWVAASRGRP